MIRNILRQYPLIYALVRTFHVGVVNLLNIPRNIKAGIYYKSIIGKIVSKNKKVWYFCVPQHNNLGDYAQYVCIKKWISDACVNFEILELPSCIIAHDYVGFIRLLRKKIAQEDLLIFQSGYTSTDLHEDEKVHRKIVSVFINNRIVFFPQTVKYSSEKEACKTAPIYNAHQHILFMARDLQSYNIALHYFTNTRVLLMPDIVTTMIGQQVQPKERKGIFFCFRNDSEKKYTDNQIKQVFKHITTEHDEWGDTTLDKNTKCSSALIDKTIERFACHKLVITDRFHGTIFSMTASTPVVVIPTVDHKVSEGANWFITKYPRNIVKVYSLEEALDKAGNMLNSTHEIITEKYYKEKYYDSLINIIKEL